jgi:hypothetical protein
MGYLRAKMDATDLKFEELAKVIGGHELRPSWSGMAVST